MTSLVMSVTSTSLPQVMFCKVTVQGSRHPGCSIDPTKPKVDGNGQPFADLTRVTIDDVVASLQAQVTEAEIA